MSNDPGSETGVRPSRSVRWLLAVSILANAALAYGYFELRQDLDGADDRIDESAADAEEGIELATAAALAEIPVSVRLDSDVATLQREMSDLERALFGFGGAPAAQTNMIGKLRQDIDFGGGDYEFLRTCFNRALSDSFESYDRANSNQYLRTYFVSSC
jgi:hypothetical protein